MKLTRMLSALALALTAVSAANAQQVMASPKPDPRVGLKSGTMKRWDKDTTKFVIDTKAAETQWNMKLLSNTPPSENFVAQTNSDLAFTGKYAIQGNYNGYQVWDISTPTKPTLATAYFCPASQSDVSVYGKLMFVSSEAGTARLDCGRGTMDSIDKERIRGIRVFDGTDITKPKYLTNVQSCRGSHTHTVVNSPNDKENVYIYISGTSTVRSEKEVSGCLSLPRNDPNSACFRIEIIQVPIASPEKAKIVSSARIFDNLPAPTKHADPVDSSAARGGGRGAAGAGAAGGGRGAGGAGGGRAAGPPPGGASVGCGVNGPPAPRGAGGGAGAAGGANPAAAPAGGRGNNTPQPPNQCHDITVYPAIGLAGGACAGLGLLLDIKDPAHPKRIDFVADSNFSFWHSATFNNEGTKILFSDEWGGGSAPRCRSTDKLEWGADALFTLSNNKMSFKSYYKMPAAQTTRENCVAHNGSLIPIPGRDVMVQSWYQGGVSVFDWTDIAHPTEIAFFDRGPIDSTRQGNAGTWSAYWYNGVIVSSEIGRGLDIFEISPSNFISQNELDAAKTVHYDQLNVQDQPKMIWPASFALARAFVDQLGRSNGMAAARITAVRADIAAAEKLAGTARKSALSNLAIALNAEAGASKDPAKVKMLAGAVGDLAK